MKRTLIATALLLTLTVMNPNCSIAQMQPDRGFKIGAKAPEITMNNPDGKPMSLSSLRGKMVLIDFWASWCGPCRMVAPIVDEIAKEFDGKIKVFKLNTDENPNVASQYGIRSIPTLMVFKDGQKVDTVVGAVPKSTLAATISKYI